MPTVLQPIEVKISDLDEVKALLADLVTEVDNLRHLVQQWEPRVTCPQCGKRYTLRACGPTHAAVNAMVGRARPTTPG